MKHHPSQKIEYIVEHGGLSAGEHVFEFDIDNAFMQQYHTEALENNFQIHAEVTIVKYNHNIQAKVNLSGTVSVVCDKCLLPYSYPINFSAHLLVEKGNPDDSTDEVLMVEENDNKINLSQYLYETISLSLPFKIVPCEEFENVQCNEDVLNRIQKNLQDENKFTTFAELFKNKFKP